MIAYGQTYAEDQCSILEAFDYNPATAVTRTNKKQGSFVSNGEDAPLYAYCLHRADCCVFTIPLNSGYSLDVHGQILVTMDTSSAMAPEVLTFKALDSGVWCNRINK